MENFRQYFERIMDLDYVFLERFFVEIGKEICPQVSLLAHQDTYTDDEAQVYLWKRCCLQHNLRWLQSEHAPRCLYID